MSLKRFHEELENITNDLADYGDYALGMLTDGMSSLRGLDTATANDVMDRKARLYDLHSALEDKTMRLLLLYQPVAEDLRTIVCINVMNHSYYRVGRIGKDIAKAVLGETPETVPFESLFVMADIVVAMHREVLEAFRTGSAVNLEDLGQQDDRVDAMRASLFREYLTYMLEDPKNIRSGIEAIGITRHLERAGDHACIMAEKIYFMAEGGPGRLRENGRTQPLHSPLPPRHCPTVSALILRPLTGQGLHEKVYLSLFLILFNGFLNTRQGCRVSGNERTGYRPPLRGTPFPGHRAA
jgi:phosphate transport system protein